MRHDLELSKTAVLYGDEALLCSPTSHALGVIVQTSELMSSGGIKEKIRAIAEMSKVVAIPQESQQLLEVLAGIVSKKHPSPHEIILKKLTEKGLDAFWKKFVASDFNLKEGYLIKQFLSAASTKCLAFERFEGSKGWPSAETVFSRFMAVIRAAVASDLTYPLLDFQTGFLVKSEILQGHLTLPETTTARSRQVGLMAKLFEALPQFDLASLDEILDIRKELDPYLARFRSAMIRFSEQIDGTAWDATFSHESERVFRRDVAPALEDIEDQTHSNGYLAKLTSRYAQSPSRFAVPVLSLAVSQLPTFPEILSLGFGITSVGTNVLDAFNEWREEKRSISRNQLFFYFKAGRILE